MLGYQRRDDDIKVSQMHVFAVPELRCKHVYEQLKNKQEDASMKRTSSLVNITYNIVLKNQLDYELVIVNSPSQLLRVIVHR